MNYSKSCEQADQNRFQNLLGAVANIVAIGLMARQLSRQVIELVFEVLPDNRMKVIFSPLEKEFQK
jgi:hypothetical protein